MTAAPVRLRRAGQPAIALALALLGSAIATGCLADASSPVSSPVSFDSPAAVPAGAPPDDPSYVPSSVPSLVPSSARSGAPSHVLSGAPSINGAGTGPGAGRNPGDEESSSRLARRHGAAAPFSGAAFDIANFATVHTGSDGRATLLRGGQPDERGLRQLRAAGVRTIVDLRTETDEIASEKRLCKDLGMRFVSIPMPIFARPPAKQFERFIAIASDPDREPVFVHCQHGEDRTGAMIGAWRVARDGWSFARAFQEMCAHNFKPGLANLTDGLVAFARRYDSAAAPPPPGQILDDLVRRASRFTEKKR